MDNKEHKLVIERFTELKTERQKYVSRWKDVQNYVAITNDINSEFEDNKQPNEQKDIFINDPTGFISTNQAGDYLSGILWNSGIITLEPSDYIKKQSSDNFEAFYKRATKITQEQFDSTDAGFLTILKSYCYDQFSYGTSGIGVFRSKEFDNEQSECCLTFKSYGVWNSCVDEGANNKINVVYTVYHWRLNRIIEEFCCEDGEVKKELVDKLPDDIKKSYDKEDFNKKFKLIYGILPNNHYKIGVRGVKGAKFKGYWFLDNSKEVFKTDYYKEMPVAMCRATRVNNQVYGECAGTLAISTIKMLNHVSGVVIDNIDKQTDIPLGMISGSLVSGNVLDRSAGSATVLNAQASGSNPVFPLAPVGDISAVCNFLIPELKKDTVNIYKIDQLLDFNNQVSMTATESAYRMSIRGKSTQGLVSQQKTECLEPIGHRGISVIQDCGLYGYILDELPEITEEDIRFKEEAIKKGEVIPDVIAQAMKDGKRWYKIRFNGELEKLANAELYEAVAKFLQFVQAVGQLSPETLQALKPYQLLKMAKDISNLNNDDLLMSETDFNDLLASLQQAQLEQQQFQNALLQSQVAKNSAGAAKEEASANETNTNAMGSF